MEVAMAQYETKTAKRVYLYRNGITTKDAKMMVVNDRQIRDFSTFLTRVTSGLKAPVAIRNIYTPRGGHRVKALGDLKAGQYYVASGSEQFRKVKYGGPPRLLPRRQPKTEFFVPPRIHQAVVASARYRRPVEKPFVIHVFRNGDEQFHGVRVLLPRKLMSSWEHVLEQITEKAELFTPAKRLCTIDGQSVHAVSELQDGNKYVALEGSKTFQKVAYCATEEKRALRNTFPRVPIRLHGVRRRATHRVLAATNRHREKPTLVATTGDEMTDEGSTALKRERRKSRPWAGRKNKEAREKAVQDHREDSIFGGSPSRLEESFRAEMPSPPAVRRLKKHHPKQLKSGAATPKYASNSPKKTKQRTPAKQLEQVRDSLNSTSGAESPVPAAQVEDTSASYDGRGSGMGVFHANEKPKVETPQNEYVEESQGETVFKAKNSDTEEGDIPAVEESQDLEVERPLDLEEAKEVAEEEEPATGTELQTQPTQGTLVATTKQQSTDNEATTPVANSSRPPTEPVESLHSEKNSRSASTTLNTNAKPSDEDSKLSTGGDEDVPEEVEEDSELKNSLPLPASAVEELASGVGGNAAGQQAEDDTPQEVAEEEQPAPLEETVDSSSPKPQSRAASKVSSLHAATPPPLAQAATAEEPVQEVDELTKQETAQEDDATLTATASSTKEEDGGESTAFVVSDPPP